MSYGSAESGVNEVYVQPFPPTGGKWQISSGGGTQPRWRADGRELFYLAPDRRIMSVAVSTTPAFSPGPSRVLFRVENIRADITSFAFDVTRDGQRFLINRLRPRPTDTGITCVLNWTALLGR